MITSMLLSLGTLNVVFDNGAEVKSIRKEDRPDWDDIVAAYRTGDEQRLRVLLSAKAVMEEYSNGDITIDGTGVLYRGHPLQGVDVERVLSFKANDLPYEPLANYMARKMANTSQRAIQELYPWLEHRNITLTRKGTFIGYKGVQNNFFSVMGNTSTIVLQGVVDAEGHILNEIGKTIEIARQSVCDDFRKPCGPGLHVGSLSYATGWGQRCILVEVDPADVVSVPTDCDCQKLRVCKYTVVGEYCGPLPDTYTPEFDGEEEVCPQCGEHGSDCECAEAEDCGCECCNCGQPAYPDITDGPNSEPPEETSVNAVEQAAQDAGILPGGNPEDFEGDYLQGMKEGIEDKALRLAARYIWGDQLGADSTRHEAFIDGYINGYK